MYINLEEVRKPVTILLKGPNGSGKTTLLAQLPDVVIFNFDNNLSGLMKLAPEVRKRVRVIQPKLDDEGKPVPNAAVWDRFVKSLEKVLADKSVKTIGIDSMTTLTECLFDKILGTGEPSKKIELQHWNDIQRYLKWLGEDVLCANDLDKNIVFLAHEEPVMDSSGAINQLVLSFGGKKLKTSYGLYFTDCWRTFTKVSGTDVKYCLRTVPDVLFEAKCSLPLPPMFEVKDQIAAIQKLLAERVA